MSLSSLPDIFRKGGYDSPGLQRQGAPFSLHLSAQPVDNHTPSRAGYAPGESCFSTLQPPRRRSISTVSMRPKGSILRDQNNKKPMTARDKMVVIWREQLEYMTGNPVKQKGGISVLNVSNFPYQTNRSINNMTIDLQEADSLQNQIDFNINQSKVAQDHLQQIRVLGHEIRKGFNFFVEKEIKELSVFQQNFTEKLKECYRTLSKLRRQTHDQVKGNRSEIDKVQIDIDTCTSFVRDIDLQSLNLFQECLSVDRNPGATSMRPGTTSIRPGTTSIRPGTTSMWPGTTSIRPVSPNLDFEEISEIPKSSRGATGELSRRTRVMELLRRNESNGRRHGGENQIVEEQGALKINGKEIGMLNIEDC